MMTSPLSSFLQERTKLINSALRRMLPAATIKPTVLHQAMRYSLFAGGKRLRPLLCLAAAEACSSKEDSTIRALPAACALECLHTYSLIHDDLPAMDNDDWRRGKPTSHKVFGEGIAILAGDALLTLSFELLAQIKTSTRYPLALILKEFSYAAGSRQLIAGQTADLQAEGQQLSLPDVRFIHERKTAALITLSLRLGAMSVNASSKQLTALTKCGTALGMAFQIIDDILDRTQSREQLGKSAGKDLSAQKATYPSLIGLPASIREATRLTRVASESLTPLGNRGKTLTLFTKKLLERTY